MFDFPRDTIGYNLSPEIIKSALTNTQWSPMKYILEAEWHSASEDMGISLSHLRTFSISADATNVTRVEFILKRTVIADRAGNMLASPTLIANRTGTRS
jgi:hypothetical protein